MTASPRILPVAAFSKKEEQKFMAIRRVGMVAVAVAVIVLLAPACNTLRGMGKDVEKTGEKIQEVAS